MNGITHKQAQRYLQMDLDDLLTTAQRLDLETHLRACEACRAESESFSKLAKRLQAEFHSRWDLRQDGPSQNVLTSIHAKSRRIIMQKRIDFAFNIFGGIVTLLVLFFLVSTVISQFPKKSIVSNGTQTGVPASAPNEERLLAFTSRQSGNYEIYTVRSDGSGVRNITNNPADDVNPYWSPDGKHIAFQSGRNSDYYSQLFLMDADGSNSLLLTTDKGNHELPLNLDGKTNPWSPDGSKLLFLRQGLSEGEWILQSVDIHTGNITSLATGRYVFSNISWSPDGKHIGFVLNAAPDKYVPQLHVVRADGTNLINISSLLPPDEALAMPYNHSWSRDGESVSFITSNMAPENTNRESYTWKIYEAGVDGSLTVQATTRSPIGGAWNGVYFISPIGSVGWTWMHPDGSLNTINPTKECEPARSYDSSTNSYTSAVANFSQSPNGNGVIIDLCPDGNVHVSWVNSAGTESKPIAKVSTAPTDGYLDWVQWSQDEQFIAFHIASPDTTDVEVYIVNIAESLQDPSIPPVKISLGKSEFPYLPAWQPVAPLANEDLTEKSPTPESEKISSYDGLIAFTSEQDGNLDIYTMRADGSALTNITNNSGRDMDPVWSPDGKRIAFLSDDRSGSGNLQIYSMNPDGTDLIRLTNTPDTEWWAGLDWSPDGQYLVAQHFPIDSEQTTPGQGHNNIYLINANGSGATRLTENESGGDYLPKWSPKGDLIAFLHSESNSTQMYTIHPDGTGLFKLSNSERNDAAFNWSSDGSRINYISSLMNCFPPENCPRNEIWSVHADGTERLKLLALPIPDGTLDQIDWVPDRIDWSPDGTRFVLVTWDSPPGSAGSSYLSVLSPFNNSDAIQKKLPGHIADSSWSPDGLFFTYSSDVSGNWDIYTLDVTDVLQNSEAEPLQITNSPSADTSPAWQPVTKEDLTERNSTLEPEKTSSHNGLIAFTSEQDGNAEIYTMYSNSSNQTNITNNPANDSNPAWSPDGQKIAFLSERTGNLDIFVMNPDGSDVRQLTDNPGYDGFITWSPDGQKIVYLSSQTGDANIAQVYVMNADGSDRTVLLADRDSYIFLGWSPNGQKIVYQRQNHETNNLQDSETHVIDINGMHHYQWRAIVDEIKWIDDEHFVGHGWSGISEPPSWKLYKFDANGSDPIEIMITPARIVALFDQTYLVEDVRTFAWYSIADNTAPLKSWDFNTHCKYPGDHFLQETGHTISPDEAHAFVNVHCREGTTWFYLENADGSQFVQLTNFSTDPEQVIDTIKWSPDGKFVTMTITGGAGGSADIYLFDIQKMLNDPSTQPIQLTTDGTWKYGAVWQPSR